MDDNSKPTTNLIYLGLSSELRTQIQKLLHKGSGFEYFADLDDAFSHLISKNCRTEIVVISDLSDLAPLAVLLKIKKAQCTVPIIVLSENKKSSLAIEIIKITNYQNLCPTIF